MDERRPDPPSIRITRNQPPSPTSNVARRRPEPPGPMWETDTISSLGLLWTKHFLPCAHAQRRPGSVGAIEYQPRFAGSAAEKTSAYVPSGASRRDASMVQC